VTNIIIFIIIEDKFERVSKYVFDIEYDYENVENRFKRLRILF